MRLDGVVPFGQNGMPDQVDLGFLFGRDLQAGRVVRGIQIGAAAQPLGRLGGADELQRGLVADQRVPAQLLLM